MPVNFFRTLNKNRLRCVFIIFFVLLGVPTLVLIQQAFSQLKWQAFHQQRLLAEELSERIEKKFVDFINIEEARLFADYAFLNVTGNFASNFLQPSSLSAYPPNPKVPGLIGYFQIDTNGRFSSPLLPKGDVELSVYGISSDQGTERLLLHNKLLSILSENHLTSRNRLGNAKSGVEKAGSDFRANQAKILEEVLTQEHSQPYAESAKHESKTSLAAPALDDETISSQKPNEEQHPYRAIGLAGDDREGLGASTSAQAAFDQLNVPSRTRAKTQTQMSTSTLGRVEDLDLDATYGSRTKENARSGYRKKNDVIGKRVARKEREALPEPAVLESNLEISSKDKLATLKINIFESEIDPFEFSLLDSGHFVLHRRVWRDGQRYIQGMLLEQQAFLNGFVEDEYRLMGLASVSSLIVAFQGEVLSAYRATSERRRLNGESELSGMLLDQFKLSAPFSGIELLFKVRSLPIGPAGSLVSWVSGVLTLILLCGLYLMYRLARRQLDLTQQQQNFVSAVSHELKTPLTSIRMYGELLKQGWADEEKKRNYYDYIFDESERLSRLIENILQLARVNRNDLKLDIKPISVSEVVDNICSKISTQLESAGFSFKVECENDIKELLVNLDIDAFIQIIINLSDNAIKFSKKSKRKAVHIGFKKLGEDCVVLSIRDFGPGIDRDQIKKIFKLFYRTENELTRKTVGTGIGLALVQQLTTAMGGEIDVINRDPGVEFRLAFRV